jgi:hypothetical protein
MRSSFGKYVMDVAIYFRLGTIVVCFLEEVLAGKFAFEIY